MLNSALANGNYVKFITIQLCDSRLFCVKKFCLSESWLSGYGTGFIILGSSIWRWRPPVFLNRFDHTTDLSFCSFTFFISSSHRTKWKKVCDAKNTKYSYPLQHNTKTITVFKKMQRVRCNFFKHKCLMTLYYAFVIFCLWFQCTRKVYIVCLLYQQQPLHYEDFILLYNESRHKA